MGRLEERITRIVSGMHRAIFDTTHGRALSSAGRTTVVRLTTTGRKSGEPRVAMLSTPLPIDDRIVLIASFGGSKEHPRWYLNLRDNPRVTVNVKGKEREMLAHTATPDEKQQLWPQIVKRAPQYAMYQRRTDRAIPVVILEPLPTGA